MARRGKGPINPREVALIELVLQTDRPMAKKQALQRLCGLLRQGYRLANPLQVKGLLFINLRDADSKVKRWAFNALAQIGGLDDVQFITSAWLDSRSDGEVFEAGLTALAHILPRDALIAQLRSAGVEFDATAVMAVAQQSDYYSDDLCSLTLDIDAASTDQLRSAELLIGLGKAPAFLFSPRHQVPDVIGDFNAHNDPIVAQYSFWATVEHPALGLKHTRIVPAAFSTLPPNVQGWAYRLLTKDKATASEHYDLIIEGSQSAHRVVREGVAIGLGGVFYDSLDIEMVDWLRDEQDADILEHILEHMARFAANSSAYRDEVLRAYRISAPGSLLRTKLEAANVDDKISLQLRRIALQTGEPDFFEWISGGHVTNNNQNNFGDNAQIGGIGVGAPGNTGNVTFNNADQAKAAVDATLQELLQKLNLPTAPSGAKTGAELVDAAIKKPTKPLLERVVSWLKLAKDGGESVAGLGTMASDALDKLEPALDWFS